MNRLSYGLKNLGIEKGDRVAYLAPNTVEMLEGFYGIFQLGAVMVPLNIRLTPEDYRFILNHSGSKVLFVHQEMYHLIEPVKDELETVEQIIIHYKEDDCAEIDYDRWLDRFPPEPFPRAGLDENDVCSLLYTSGTTGNPKGVMLTHRNNYLHALSAMHHLRVTPRCLSACAPDVPCKRMGFAVFTIQQTGRLCMPPQTVGGSHFHGNHQASCNGGAYGADCAEQPVAVQCGTPSRH